MRRALLSLSVAILAILVVVPVAALGGPSSERQLMTLEGAGNLVGLPDGSDLVLDATPDDPTGRAKAAHTYWPGNLGFEGEPFGPPVVRKGAPLTFINEDFLEGGVRHSITSCKAPCNGEYMVNYPFHDGGFHSGALGYTWQETYVTARDEPRWELDTSNLATGYHTYYCQLHAWMRGSFYVK